MGVEDVEDGVGPVLLRLLDVPADLVPAGGGEDRDLLAGHHLHNKKNHIKDIGKPHFFFFFNGRAIKQF